MDKTKYTDLLKSKLIYKNQNFHNNVFELNFETDDDILFENCIFEGITSFENIKAREVLFIECKFKDILSISDSSFFVFGFTNCLFYQNVRFTSNICISHTVFRNVIGEDIELNGEYQALQFVATKFQRILLKDVNSEYSGKDSKIEFLDDNLVFKVDFKSYACFSNIVFKGGKYNVIDFQGNFNNQIYFKSKIITEYLFFESSVFKSRIDFREGHFDYINFYRSTFFGSIIFDSYDILKDERSKISVKYLNMHSSQFERNVIVSIDKLNYLDLSNNNFRQMLNFNNNNVIEENLKNLSTKKISLSGTNQGNIIVENIYADITINDINLGNVYFKNINLHTLEISELHNKGSISFSNIKSGVYFVIQDSIIGDFNLLNEDLNIFKEIVVSNSNLKGLVITIYPKKIHSYSSNPKVGYGLEDKSKDNQNLKNIYNQLKQIAKSNGDVDHMNKYNSLEFIKMIRTKRVGFDSILLLLNWISNNNGQSWVRGVLFTLIIGYLFFLLYIKSIGVDLNMNNMFKNYILYFSSFPKLQLEKYSGMSQLWNVSFVIWISRIFISYGIYQTIAAFRKYGK